MELFTPILTIAIFVLYTFIFSLFIVPTLKDLREIRLKLRGVVKSSSLLKKEDDNFRKEQRKQITDILKDYKLRHQEIRQSTGFLIWGVITTGLAAFFLVLVAIPSGKNILLYIFYNTELLIFVFYVAIVLILMIITFARHIPSPRRITEWEYLVKNFGLSPSGLAECADFKIDFNPRNRSIFEQFDPKEKRPIQIFSSIELRGYKYWFFIYNKANQKIVFKLIGVVNRKTNLNERFFDVDDFYGWSTTVSEFDAYKFKDIELQMFFFVFDPILYGDIGEPYWGYSEFKYDGTVSFSSIYSVSLNKATYSKIKYFGNGLKLKKLKWDEDNINLSEKDKEKINSTQYWNIVKKAFDESKEALLKK